MINEKKRFSIPCLGIALCLLAVNVLHAGTESVTSRSAEDWVGHVSVGPSGCDYSDLQDAIDDGAAGGHGGHIGVHADYEMTGEYVMDQFAVWVEDPWIAGGFSSCNVGDLGSASTRTVLDADNQSRHFTIEFDAQESDSFREVRLQNFRLVNGSSNNAGAVAISSVHGRLSVHILNSVLTNNTADPFFGGAIWVSSTGDTIVDNGGFPPPPIPPLAPPLLVLGDDTWIDLNSAETFGGGIHCTGGGNDISGRMMSIGNALISRNHAGTGGGGISANNCPFVMPAGGPWALAAIPDAGIALNTTDDRGGGILASGGSNVIVTGRTADFYNRPWGGDPDHSAMVVGNEANRGGGLYATGSGTVIALVDAVIGSNQAVEVDDSPGQGGGIYAVGQAMVEFGPRNVDTPCRPPTFANLLLTYPPCNHITSNSADDQGGAAYVQNGAHLIINDAYISNNSAELAEIAYAINSAAPSELPAARVEIENSLMTGNGDDLTPGQSLIVGDWESEIDIRWSTMAGNFDADSPGAKITMDGAILAETSLTIIGSILWSEDSDVSLVDRGADTIDEAMAVCLIGHRPDTETGIASSNLQYYSQIDPEIQSNHRLSFTSPAIDYCNDQPVPERDLDGRVRDAVFGGDTTEAPNAHPDGIHDIGAFTVQEPMIFHDRFEAD